MNNTKNATMLTLFFSTSQGQKHYTVTSIDALRKNLKKFHKIDIKRRWCFAAIRYLIDNGYIRRQSRYVHDFNGLIRQIPSMEWFTLKGVVWLVNKGVVGAKKLYKSMVTYLRKGDKRSPSKDEFDDGRYQPATAEERKRLNDLLTSATKDINEL